MRINFLIITAAACLVFSSCITSLHPLVKPENAITDARIEGNWKGEKRELKVQAFFQSDLYKKYKASIDKDLKGKEKTDQTDSDSALYVKSYIVEWVRDGIRYDVQGSLTRINGQLYMNFTPIISQMQNDTSLNATMDPGKSISSYTIARIQFLNASELKIDFFDSDFIYNQVKAGRMKIKHESDDLYDTFLITADPQELRQFIEKYGNDNRLYNKENTVTLIRKR